ncbi:MAG: hypothetical protein LBQ80_01615 [Clostridium sp.]|jgi:hypothetical protein|nr:hypothetical protein [Clostridium sp.]
MKKLLVPILCALLLTVGLTLGFGVTRAVLYSFDDAVNEFIVGENTIDVTENFEPPEVLDAGVEFHKNAQVSNTGNLDCFVRVRADFSTSIAEDFCEELVVNSTYWTAKQPDGYYYYKAKLEPDETTQPLFLGVYDGMEIKVKDDAPYWDLEQFKIYIYAETKLCPDGKGDSDYLTIW